MIGPSDEMIEFEDLDTDESDDEDVELCGSSSSNAGLCEKVIVM